MDYKANRHAVYRLQYHLVVVTKYRHEVINKDMNIRLKEIAYNIFEDSWQCEIIEIESEADHLHIAFEAYPQIQLSKLINNFKTVSSRYIRKEFAEYLKPFFWKPFFWSPSYCLLSVGEATIDTIKEYIRNQDKPR